jgi:hypothetical protein
VIKNVWFLCSIFGWFLKLRWSKGDKARVRVRARVRARVNEGDGVRG